MFALAAMSNSTSISEEASVSSETRVNYCNSLNCLLTSDQQQQQPQPSNSKKKRSQPGNPDPDAEVIALSPRTLMTTNRFVCEICNKGFQRDQNLQLHRRGHNLPWKLKQKSSKDGGARKRVYVCPEPTCVHHHPSRALGDLTGIKKHFSRKHGEKKWKCDKCSKKYAVHSDWKAHVKTCGTKEYICDCGTIFSRKDSFITHRAFCDALAEESARLMAAATPPSLLSRPLFLPFSPLNSFTNLNYNPHPSPLPNINPNPTSSNGMLQVKHENPLPSFLHPYLIFNNLCTSGTNTITSTSHLSATALLQKAASIGPLTSTGTIDAGHQSAEAVDQGIAISGLDLPDLSAWRRSDLRLTRDFLGVQASRSEATDQNELLDLVTSSTGIHGGSPSQQYSSFAPGQNWVVTRPES